jgi:hypothetical protein
LFGSLKVERLHGQRSETIREANDETSLLWYNRTLMHSPLNYIILFQRFAVPCTAPNSFTVYITIVPIRVNAGPEGDRSVSTTLRQVA